MKILLIGNYKSLHQQSMLLFAELLHRGMQEAGHDVRLIYPPAVLGRLRNGETGLAKWIGYIDRYILFPPLLRMQKRWADVVHVCADAIYIPHLRGTPSVVTCHDVLPIRAAMGQISESSLSFTGRMYQRWFLRSLKKAQSVVCVSRQTREEALLVGLLSSAQMRVVHNGLNYPYRTMALKQALPLVQALGINTEQPFFLHVGGNHWNKNRMGVIRIFSELIKYPAYRTHNLVMAGKALTPELRQLANRLDIEQRVIEQVGPSNEELRALYSTSEALLFASLQEGFGWPIIEAQACECPVITTNRAPMTEVGGRAAIYIDPADEREAAKAIAAGLTARKRLKAAGIANAARYSAERMIDGYIHSYRSAIRRHESVAGGS